MICFGRLIALTAVLLLIASCARQDTLGEPPPTDGSMLTVSEALDPAQFGRTITVTGQVHKVCQDEGCWMSITDGSSYLRMTFKDDAFYVPTTLSGTVVVRGVVQETVVEEEVAKAIGGSIGLDNEAIESISGDQRVAMMVATGVRMIEQ